MGRWASGSLSHTRLSHGGHSKPCVTDTRPTAHCPPRRPQNLGKRAVLPPAEGTGNLCFLLAGEDPLEPVQLLLTHPSRRPSASGFWGIWCSMDKARGLAGGKQGAVELLNVESDC